MNKTKLKPIIIVVVIGIILGGLILGWDEIDSHDIEYHADNLHAHDDHTNDEEGPKGPNGGMLFTTDDFSVEVTIFEQGVEPQFRIYLYEKGKLLPATAAKVAITLTRLGSSAQLFKFTAVDDYLVGDQIVIEPHSFEIAIAAEWQGKTFHWGYEQIEARIEMSNETLATTGIEVKTAKPGIISPTRQLPGVIAFNHHNVVKVVPRVPGIVVTVNYHLGQQAEKGEVLAVIESPILADLRSQFLAAQKRLVLARSVFQREQQLWKEKITAKQDYLAAQQLASEAEIILELAAAKLQAFGEQPETVLQQENLTRYEIRAPISGLVVTKSIARGEVIEANTEIFTLVNVSTMYAELTVYPKDLGIIKIDQQAIIQATSQDVIGEGTISYISALIDPQTRTAKARVTLENDQQQWRAGMFINATLTAQSTKVPVAVSVDAIQTLYDWSVVFGRYGQYFEARPVELGHNDGKMVEIRSGLLAGEQYAAGNSFAVKAELGKAGASHDH